MLIHNTQVKNKRIKNVICSKSAVIEPQDIYYKIIILQDNLNVQMLLTLNKSMSSSQTVPETIKPEQ